MKYCIFVKVGFVFTRNQMVRLIGLSHNTSIKELKEIGDAEPLQVLLIYCNKMRLLRSYLQGMVTSSQ
jgi:hypothetical protein